MFDHFSLAILGEKINPVLTFSFLVIYGYWGLHRIFRGSIPQFFLNSFFQRNVYEVLKVMTSFIFRYEARRAGDLPEHAPREASDDVLRHPLQGHPPRLQEVHARCRCPPPRRCCANSRPPASCNNSLLWLIIYTYTTTAVEHWSHIVSASHMAYMWREQIAVTEHRHCSRTPVINWLHVHSTG